MPLNRLILALESISKSARLSDTVLLVDRDMNVLYQNDAAIRLLGDKVGGKCYDAMDGGTCDCCPLREYRGDNGAHNTLRTIRMPDGEARYLEITANPVFDEYGMVVGSVGIGRDVTHLKEMEEARKTELSMLSHDLKSPLTAMQGYIDLLLDKKDRTACENAEMLRTVKKSSMKLIGLVEDFLTLSQIEAGKMHIEPRPVDLAQLVDSHAEEFRAIAEKRNVRIHTEVPKGLPAALLDERHSGRVISNLLFNAIKYSGDGAGIWIRAGMAEDEGGKVFLEVSDNGPGIPAEELPHLFERYSPAASRRCGTGTGLGLATVKALTELQGGTVEASCNVGAGTTIKLTLPAAN